MLWRVRLLALRELLRGRWGELLLRGWWRGELLLRCGRWGVVVGAWWWGVKLVRGWVGRVEEVSPVSILVSRAHTPCSRSRVRSSRTVP
ncbi:hypothetical protein, partial [Nocardia farcinica]|uniref:hypothetical protein n=1 Tax=Nocardia farcinica TaxID=37329 RepID=UPI0024588183